MLLPVIKSARMVHVATMGGAELIFAFTFRSYKRQAHITVGKCTSVLHSV
jgi:hypothetical protein